MFSEGETRVYFTKGYPTSRWNGPGLLGDFHSSERCAGPSARNRWAAKLNALEKKTVIGLATTDSAKKPIVPG